MITTDTAVADSRQHHVAAWLKEASRHQQNAAYCAAMAMSLRDCGALELAVYWQHGADAAAHNALSNLFAAMHMQGQVQ